MVAGANIQKRFGRQHDPAALQTLAILLPHSTLGGLLHLPDIDKIVIPRASDDGQQGFDRVGHTQLPVPHVRINPPDLFVQFLSDLL